MAKENEENLSPEERLSNCLLSQYMLCAGGVLGGAAYGINTKKGVLPMVVAGVAGTMADMAYGYVIACKKEVELVEESKKN